MKDLWKRVKEEWCIRFHKKHHQKWLDWSNDFKLRTLDTLLNWRCTKCGRMWE